MCAILAMSIDGSKFIDNKDVIKVTINEMATKGHDYYRGVVVSKSSSNNVVPVYVTSETINDFTSQIINLIDLFSVSSDIGILLFSRATPEMENSNATELQPYKLNKLKDNSWIAAHGTIPDADELAEMVESIVDIDTEIFKYMKQSGVHRNTKGKVVSFKMSVNYSIEVEIYNNGLGYWTYERSGLKIISNYNVNEQFILQTKSYDLISSDTDVFKHTVIGPAYYSSEAFVSFSGGMDIVASVMKYLEDSRNLEHLTLVYFDYGQVAKKQELKTMRVFKDYLINKYPNIQIHTKVLHVSELFSIYGKTRLTDSTTKGNVKETEQSISYVNFRNSLFATILAGYAEKVIMKKYNESIPVDIIFGLNLSEGMIMSDNTYAWLESMNKSIRFGGDFSSDFAIIAPFVNNTKTEIAQYMNKFGDVLYDISFSCYYPVNGNPCNECGSCILRNKAKARSTTFNN